MVPKATCPLPWTGHEEKVNLLYRITTQVKDDTRFPQCHPFSSTLRLQSSLQLTDCLLLNLSRAKFFVA